MEALMYVKTMQALGKELLFSRKLSPTQKIRSPNER